MEDKAVLVVELTRLSQGSGWSNERSNERGSGRGAEVVAVVVAGNKVVAVVASNAKRPHTYSLRAAHIKALHVV